MRLQVNIFIIFNLNFQNRKGIKKMNGRNIGFKLAVSTRKFPEKKKNIRRDGLRTISNLILTIDFLFLFFFFNKFIYLFLAALGLCCCARAFSSCSEQGLLFLVVCGLLLLQSTGSRHAGFSSCGTWAQQLWLAGSRGQAVVVAHGLSCSAACGIFLDQGSNPCPLHLAGGFLTTVPPGKSQVFLIIPLSHFTVNNQSKEDLQLGKTI